MVISMLKIRRPLGRLIFNMGIAIPGKTVFLIETPPRFISIHISGQSRHSSIIQAVFMVRLLATCKQSVKVLITIQEKRVRTHVR